MSNDLSPDEVLLIPCGARHMKALDRTPPGYDGPVQLILCCVGPVGHDGCHLAMFGSTFFTWESS